MDLQLLGTGGVGVTLVAVIVYLLRQNHSDRRQYQEHIAAVEKRTQEAIATSAARADAEIAGLRQEVSALRSELESERRMRWAAEDSAAHYRRLYETQPGGGTT